MSPRRCELAVPGSNYKMITKAASLPVDVVMLDLEDAVAPEARPETRQNIIRAAQELDWQSKTLAFRINAVSSPYFYQDLIAVVEAAGDKIGSVIIPKVNRPEEVYTVAALLTAIEADKGRSKSLAIEAQIESAEGMLKVEQIAATAPGRLEALIFGPGDYAASLGMPGLTIGAAVSGYPGHIWQYALSRLLVAARTYGLEAIDGPYANFKDEATLRETAHHARLLGLDGKWAIHPAQIAPIQEIFSPDAAELERARRIVEAYQTSINSDTRGAITFEGEMIDAATVKMAQRTLQRAAAN